MVDGRKQSASWLVGRDLRRTNQLLRTTELLQYSESNGCITYLVDWTDLFPTSFRCLQSLTQHLWSNFRFETCWRTETRVLSEQDEHAINDLDKRK